MVVDEAAEQAERGQQVARSTGLRLALAYLCSIADGPIGGLPDRRSIFDTFWREVTGEQGGNPHSATNYRASMAATCLQQIGRQLGQPALFFNLVREARLPERRVQQKFADAVKQADRERDDAGRTKRANYWGPPRP